MAVFQGTLETISLELNPNLFQGTEEKGIAILSGCDSGAEEIISLEQNPELFQGAMEQDVAILSTSISGMEEVINLELNPEFFQGGQGEFDLLNFLGMEIQIVAQRMFPQNSQLVDVLFETLDFDSAPLSIDFAEWSEDGQNWNPATAKSTDNAHVSEPYIVSTLENKIFVWDAIADLGSGFHTNLYFRLQISDATRSALDVFSNINLDIQEETMTVSFDQIPAGLLVPLTAVEFDSSGAVQGTQLQPYKLLLIGQKLAAGSATPNVPIKVSSESQAKGLFGDGSMLFGMFKKALLNNKFTEITAIPLEDNGAGVEAVGKLDFGGPATENRTLNLYLAGRRVQVAIASGDADTAIATKVVAAITAASDIPFTAVVNGTNANEVDLTYRHKGEVGNKMDLRHSYFSGEKLPTGVTLTITAMASGTANPDITSALTAMADTQYNVIVHPYVDSANLLAVKTELDTRWGPTVQKEGFSVTADNGNLSALDTLGNGQNSSFISIMESTGSPTPVYEWAASLGAILALEAAKDPARPFQTLPILGVLPPAESDRFNLGERDQILKDGIATHKVVNEVPQIERVVSTYKTNSQGDPDPAFRDANSFFTLSFMRYSLRTRFTSKFARHKLASDNTRFNSGEPILTPQIAKAEMVSLFTDWEGLGLVENVDQFKQDLVVERDTLDPNRLNAQLPPDLANQLRFVALKVSFIL